MKRTTIYLDPDLEVLLKLAVSRQKRPMAAIIREAVQAYVTREPRQPPPGAGTWMSGHADTADRAEEILAGTGFGTSPGPADRRASAKRRPRADGPKAAARGTRTTKRA